MAKISESALQQEIMAWVGQNQYVYLATVDKKQPRVRPVVLILHDSRFFFTTFSGDAKMAQISANKWVEACVPLEESGQTGYIRFSGTAKVVTNEALKAELAEACYFFDQYFHGYDDPDFGLIEFEPDYAQYLRPGEGHSQGCNLKR